jgi:ribosomal protein S18 acetylase RimI-like enzyme
MAKSNFERMIQLVTEVFDTKNDPDQLDVNQEVIEHLHRIHPATMSEYDDGNGPVAWILLIPTTLGIMNRFVAGEITEQQLLDLTPMDKRYEAIYLCSATVLEEYREKGIAKKLTMEAIERIRKDHPIKSLFVWPFSKEGDILAEKLALSLELPLAKRVAHQ